LQDVSGKLEYFVVPKPGLALVPATVSVRVEEFDGDEKP